MSVVELKNIKETFEYEKLINSGFFVEDKKLFSKKITVNNGLENNELLSNKFLEAKFVVIGENPVLNALCLLYLARKRIPAIFIPYNTGQLDCWSYNFCKHPDFRKRVSEISSFFDAPVLQPNWNLGFEVKNDGAIDWINKFFSFVRDDIAQTGFEDLVVLDNKYKATLHDEHIKNRAFLMLSENNAKVEFLDDMQGMCSDAFYGYVYKSLKKIDIDINDEVKHFSVLAKRVVLTSHMNFLAKHKVQQKVDDAYRFLYDNRFITAMGSANMQPINPEQSITQAFNDIKRIRNIFI
jgi:hypothetical protein